MLKMDGCYADRNIMPEGYLNVSHYLNATGRRIVFSCSWPAYWNGAGMKVTFLLVLLLAHCIIDIDRLIIPFWLKAVTYGETTVMFQ